MSDKKEGTPLGIIRKGNNVDDSYDVNDHINAIFIRQDPDPLWNPELFDWFCKLKPGITKDEGDPILAGDYDYMYPQLKPHWKMIVRMEMKERMKQIQESTKK